MKVISKLLGMKHPIVKISFFKGSTFEFEFHPVIIKFSKTDEFMEVYWIAMNKLHRFTKKVINTKV